MFTVFVNRFFLMTGKIYAKQFWFLALYLTACLAACTANKQTAATAQEKQPVYTQTTLEAAPGDSLIIKRKKLIDGALKQNKPVILLTDNVDEKQIFAQHIALQNNAFAQYMRSQNNEPFLNEIFGVYPARQSDLPLNTSNFGNLYRVEMYNFGLNLATVAVVDVNASGIVWVNHFAQMQPDIPPKLIEIALHIATQSTQVEHALGFKPTPQAALMANTKTALNRSRCERSQHLCVAPTFIKDDKALWAVVDLTDLKLVGVRWTNVGNSQAVTERRYQNANMMECFCRKDSLLQQNNWKMYFMLTSSDGMKISSVYYKNRLVLQSAKLVDFHVNYSNSDGFGYSDAIGCPMFSQAAVVAITPPEVKPIEENGKTTGFALEQNYFSEGWPAPCNYNYLQRYEFYDDGRFRVSVGSLGRGCGNDGTYRPVTRIAFAPNLTNFYEWSNNQWNPWKKEQWQLQNIQTSYTPEGYQYKIDNGNQSGYYMVANNGQFNDSSRGDNAYTYISKHHPDKDEGDADLVTIGPCCNTDYRQGPEKFIEPNPEPLENEPFILWYVPQIKNDDTPGKEYCWAQSYLEDGVVKVKTYPCMSGPMFIPFKP
ncbi:hypothetical protein C7N43_20165 [Sphingobacteriales bacterium UPWRP_1]|nr:hypothetical protein B6N25_01830 [Sphingobacteriales bacterium TSM_CSS]PSJ75190.1 hypothetical protein C7N43_20165 [Sphingobacteriales bacterium UPWRP_1]